MTLAFTLLLLYLVLSLSAFLLVVGFDYEPAPKRPDLLDRVIALLVLPWGFLFVSADRGLSYGHAWLTCGWHMAWHGEYLDV